MFGQNICNTAAQSVAGGIDVNSVKNLKPKWTYSASGDVSATPAVVGNAVYVPDWGGTVARLDATTGMAVWSKSVGDLLGASLTGFLSRAAPVVTTDSVYLGTQRNPNDGAGASAFVIALDPATGALKWKTQMETDPYAVITSSPVFDQGSLYVGVSSLAETKVGATFRGSVVALDARTGNIQWRTYTITDAAAGFTGASVWSSSPAVDRKRKQLYVTTGNNYSAPAGGMASVDGNYVDAVLALDLATGAIKWGRSLPGGGASGASDVFPTGGGADSDFGAGANLFTATIGGQPKDLVGAGQKSGYYWAFDPDTGQTVWTTQTGPGGVFGGIHFGTATDGNRVYVATNDSQANPWTIGGSGSQAGTSSTSGFWAALDAADGHIVWQIANPALSRPATGGGSTDGPVVVVNGVLFGGSMDPSGTMFAMNAATGEVLWSYQSGGSVSGGPAVANGVVYWGCGYSMGTFATGTPCAQLYAFTPQ
jgi:polyvinyl alcohol dehydrogenase (cytochrome)